MRSVLVTSLILLFTSAAAFAQNDSTNRDRPIISNETEQEIRQKANKVKEDIQEEVEESRDYIRANQLDWFQPGSVFIGGGLGVGTGGGNAYLAVNTRAGYFFQEGFMGGLRYDFDRRVGERYRARQAGLFVRYYPFRTRVSSFLGAGYNFGREFSDNIPEDQKARYNSVNLELGIMFWILPSLGFEGAFENNYYDRVDPAAGRSKGGRFKFGVNYYFGRTGQRL
ncbi:hypothetical protein DYU11_20315 [Fibrisoma montanum]|uniref:Outer membrane protein beta-barrel domain-containing protein n=1 Tax=Fibrisoma montanum TaxID=2305895 RepID=A0A418M3J3_9BACT|nr:hypothetical protein [Fibrisoma montanum]RIV20396.1 hypothetical protein DYU11_20315 [Fibrisoma montanum]